VKVNLSRKKRKTTKKTKAKSTKKKTKKTTPKPSKADLLFRQVTRILKKFTPTKYGKSYEKNIEEQVVQALRFGLPRQYRDQVTFEKEFGKGKRLDISVADKIGIELKLAPTSSALDRLSGQIDRYFSE